MSEPMSLPSNSGPTPTRAATPSGRRSWPRPASASTSPTTWRWPPGPRPTAGTTRRSCRTGRSRSTRRPRCCTTRRRSSRDSRRTGTPTAASGCSGPNRTPRGWPARPAGSRCRCWRPRTSWPASTRWSRADAAWVPARAEQSLYLRPFMFASEAFLGVRAGEAGHLLLHRQPGRGLLRLRCAAGQDLDLHQLHPCRAGRDRRGQVRRQLRRQPGRPAGGGRRTAATR